MHQLLTTALGYHPPTTPPEAPERLRPVNTVHIPSCQSIHSEYRAGYCSKISEPQVRKSLKVNLATLPIGSPLRLDSLSANTV